MIAAPGYWMDETSGVLRPAVERYLQNGMLTESEIAALRTYLRQWIFAGDWRGSEVDALRDTVDGLIDRASIDRWLALAARAGIDPL